MDSDLLQNLKKKRLVGEPAPVSFIAEGSEYQAFAFEAHTQRRLRFECRAEMNHSPAYLQLVDIIDNGPKFTLLGLVFSHYVYRCEGKYLQQLVALLNEEKVKRIVEFNADRWQLPQAGDAIITRITIHLRGDPALSDMTSDVRAAVKA